MAQVVDVYMISPDVFGARFDDGEVRTLSNRESAAILQTAGGGVAAPVAKLRDSAPALGLRRNVTRVTATRVTVTTCAPLTGRMAA